MKDVERDARVYDPKAQAVLTWEVGPEEPGRRLDRALAEHWPAWSRTRWQQAIAEGKVAVSGQPMLVAAYRLQSRDVVSALPPVEAFGPGEPLGYEPPLVPVPIVYEDADLLVVNKPRGMVVHPAAGHWHHTLVQALLPAVMDDQGQPLRPGVVHRLDKDTTGLMLIARSQEMRTLLARQLQDRRVERRYCALVGGHLEPPAGIIDAPIGRHPQHRTRMAVVGNGRPARTHYDTVAWWKHHSFVLLKLDTGRTHQIRVHLAHLGHPLVGDRVYGQHRHGPPEGVGLVGQALHAYFLAFLHPRTGQALTFQEPWPEDWQPALEQLGVPEAGQVPVIPSRIERGGA